MLSLLLGPFHQCLFNLSLNRYRLCHYLRIFFLSFGHCLECIRICLCLYLRSLCLGIRDNRGLYEVGLREYLIVLDLGLRVHLVNECDRLLLHLCGDPLALGSHLLYLLLLGGLLELGSLRLILPLLETLLLQVLERLVVVLDTQLIGLLFTLQGVFELEDSLFLEGMRDVIWQLHVGNDN